MKKTKIEKIDYPLVTLCGIKNKTQISAAVSGAANAPMLLPGDILNDSGLSEDDRISRVLDRIRENIMSDLAGSKEYREFVLRNVLKQMFENLTGNNAGFPY
ncbi:hypothetical protein SDC9_136935 [bioreactor metagenome]|uniref:CO dehydrogenase flavoprotein C-terminal domain-containing protein n=1 Tax=bioreactor metagenome TaxID=1076179 RepID=A0A645DK56_9ZZZZ